MEEELIRGFEVVQQRARCPVILGQEVLRLRRLTGFLGQDVLDIDTPLDSGQRSEVVVERRAPVVVFEEPPM